MSIQDLPGLGEYLLGSSSVSEQSDWLQSVLTSVSPLGNFISAGHGTRLVTLRAKFSGGAKQFVPVFKVRSEVLLMIKV